MGDHRLRLTDFGRKMLSLMMTSSFFKGQQRICCIVSLETNRYSISTFLTSQVERDGLVLLILLSTYIFLLFFFLWVYVEHILLRAKIRNITDLKLKVTDAFTNIDETMLQRIWQDIQYRFSVFRGTNTANLEVF